MIRKHFDLIPYEDLGTARTIAQQIAAMPWTGRITTEQAARIVALFPEGRRGYDIFRYLDEKPGDLPGAYRSTESGEWHVKLRQVRNLPQSPLFERISMFPERQA